MNWLNGLHVIIHTLMAIAVVKGDMYTALTKLEPLIATEVQLLTDIQEYVNREKQRIGDIERLIAHIRKERINPSSNEDSVNLGNPIQSFLLLRRLRRQWFTIKDHVNSADHQKRYLEIAQRYETSASQYPSEEDYQGSAEALLRLQETYGLQTSSVADGNLLGVQTSPPLHADDCFDIGKLARPVNMSRHIEWLEEAYRKRNDMQVDIPTQISILEHLAVAFYEQKQIEKALDQISQIINLDPQNAFAAQWKGFYERELKFIQLNDSDSVAEDQRYMALCRGDETAYGKHTNPGELRCRYTHHNSPRLFIRPAKEEILFSEPRVVYYHDLITDKEIEIIKQRAIPHMQRSITDFVGKHSHRISSQAWLDIFNPDDPLGKILPRVQDYTGLSTKVKHAEYLQVLNYGLGGFYKYHYDDETDGVSEGFQGMGKRIATVLIYMSDVDAGGATVFTKTGVRVAPVKGSGVLWYNYLKNGDRDLNSRHAGCPVLLGTKWACNLWIREFGQVFRRRCGLRQDDKY